eukprot:UN24842
MRLDTQCSKSFSKMCLLNMTLFFLIQAKLKKVFYILQKRLLLSSKKFLPSSKKFFTSLLTDNFPESQNLKSPRVR